MDFAEKSNVYENGVSMEENPKVVQKKFNSIYHKMLEKEGECDMCKTKI